MKLRAAAMLAAVLASTLLAAPALATVTLPPGNISLPTAGSFLYMNSEAGDYIGQGQEKLFTPATASIYGAVRQSTFGAQISISPTSFWIVTIAAPAGETLAVGSYTGAARAAYPAGAPGLEIYGDGRGCSTVTGQFDVMELAFSPLGDITLFDAVFEQHCEGLAPALYGRVRIESPAPVPGSTLPPGTTTVPTHGTFLYLIKSDTGSGAIEKFYAPADSSFDWTLGVDLFHAFVFQSNFTHFWFVDIGAPLGTPLTVGRYLDAVRAISRTATQPGLDVSGDGIGCNQVSGWFDVDQLDRDSNGDLLIFQSTFHFYCDNSLFLQHGRIRIDNNPPPVLGVTVDSVGKVSNKTGVAMITGTVSCSRSVSVELTGTLWQVRPDHTYVQANISATVECTAPSSPWSLAVNGALKFGASAATADLVATNCDSACVSASTSETVKLNSGK